VNPFPPKNWSRLLTPAQSATPSSRRTFPLRRLCRVSVRTRTSLHAIALRYLRPCSSVAQRLPISSRARRALLPNLLTSNFFVFLAQLLYQALSESWWTGEDSNLRSPQGAADLQSAGFSHSPTRPRKSVRHQTAFATTSYRQTIQEREGHSSENTKRTRVKRHQPVVFALQIRFAQFPRVSVSGAGGGN
jgi:hypothetical protein